VTVESIVPIRLASRTHPSRLSRFIHFLRERLHPYGYSYSYSRYDIATQVIHMALQPATNERYSIPPLSRNQRSHRSPRCHPVESPDANTERPSIPSSDHPHLRKSKLESTTCIDPVPTSLYPENPPCSIPRTEKCRLGPYDEK
jgi:hypothetical protein